MEIVRYPLFERNGWTQPAMANTAEDLRSSMTVGLAVDGDAYGGAEASLVNLVTGVADIAPQIQFLLLGHDCAALRGLADRLPLVETAIASRPNNPAARVHQCRKLVKAAKLDILQVTLCNPVAGQEAQIAGILTGTPTIVVEQLVRSIARREMVVKAALSRLLSDHIAVGTSSAAAIAQHASLPAASVRAVHNGVPEPAPDECVRNMVNPDHGRFVVGTVGRLEHQKGIDRLIPLLPRLPDVHLVIVGSGSEEAELRAQAARLNVSDRTTFTGWIDQPGEVMQSFDVFVLASQNEAFPLTIVEAMLRAVPVVATDVGSVTDAILDGETGMLVPADRPELIADRLQLLISNPGLRTDIALQGQRRAVEHFTAHSMARRYVEIWRRPRGRLGLFSGKADLRTRHDVEIPRPEVLS